jgi:hypothetical protein
MRKPRPAILRPRAAMRTPWCVCDARSTPTNQARTNHEPAPGQPRTSREPIRPTLVHDDLLTSSSRLRDACRSLSWRAMARPPPQGIHHDLLPGHRSPPSGAPDTGGDRGRQVAPGRFARSQKPATKPDGSRYVVHAGSMPISLHGQATIGPGSVMGPTTPARADDPCAGPRGHAFRRARSRPLCGRRAARALHGRHARAIAAPLKAWMAPAFGIAMGRIGCCCIDP